MHLENLRDRQPKFETSTIGDREGTRLYELGEKNKGHN